MTKPKRKQRGVVARFLAGESIADITRFMNWRRVPHPVDAVEQALRRAFKKKVGK